ncbi:divalent metal cation transporter [soil metagenome]
MNSLHQRLNKFINSILPGIFLFGYTIGTGSVTALAKTGANYGMQLLWAIAVSCFITYFLINLYGKFTVITGETALNSFRKYIHPAVGIFFIVALTAHVSGSVMGVMGIIADISHESFLLLFNLEISPVLFAVIFIFLVYAFFLIGKMQVFQKTLAVIVGIMSISFLINFFMLMPPLNSVLAGLLPSIPEETEAVFDSPLLDIASLVGTTVFSGLFIIRTIMVKEAGWTLKDAKIQKRDAMISGWLMFIISASIMASAAGTLFASGIRLERASQMINLLDPLGGTFAAVIFGIGIISAGVSSQFPNVILLPMLLSDYKNEKLNIRKSYIRIIVLIISLLGLVVPIFKASPVFVMIISQAFGSLLLPFTTLCILYLGNKKELMKEWSFNMTTNLLLIFILFFALFMAYNGLKGILSMLT